MKAAATDSRFPKLPHSLGYQNNQKKNSVYPIILRIQWFTADLPGFTWGSLLTHPTRAENVLNTPLLPTKSSPSLLPTRVLGLFNQYKLIRGWRSNSGKVLLGSLLQQEGSKNKQQVPLLARTLREGELAPYTG